MVTTAEVQILLNIVVGLSAAGLIVTAKDFYKLKSEIEKELLDMNTNHRELISKLKEDLTNRYVSKELHNTEIAGLKKDISLIADSQKDMGAKIDKIYDILIARIGHDG